MVRFHTFRSWRPVSDRVGPPTFLPSMKPTCHIYLSLSWTAFRYVGSRFARPIVTARVQSSRSAYISSLSETHQGYFSKSLANWLPVFVLLDGPWRPVTHRIGPPALQTFVRGRLHELGWLSRRAGSVEGLALSAKMTVQPGITWGRPALPRLKVEAVVWKDGYIEEHQSSVFILANPLFWRIIFSFT